MEELLAKDDKDVKDEGASTKPPVRKTKNDGPIRGEKTNNYLPAEYPTSRGNVRSDN